MSDESPEPATPDSSTPDSGTPPAETSTTEEATQPVDATTTEPARAATSDRRGVFVPRWLAILIGLVVAVGLVGGGGFWLGRETGDDHDGRERDMSEQPVQPRQVPSAPQAPNGPNLPSTPQVPQAPQGRQLLGVAVESADNGAAVVRVASGSPADDAGLQVGDVITEVDGRPVAGTTELVATIRSYEAGDEITITYERSGTASTVDVTLADVTADSGSAS